MLRCSSSVVAALVLVPVLHAQIDSGRVQRAYRRIDEFVSEVMRRERTPGVAVALTSRDRLLRVSTYGYADIAAQVPVTPETQFEIGSISKAFTAVALLQLEEEGLVDLRRPVTAYLPWFKIKSGYPPITLHHLLTHTAGLPRDRDDIPFSLYAAAALREREVGAPPGIRFAYSDIGYQVLSLLMEEVEGRPFPEIIRARVLDPLGLRQTEPAITQDLRMDDGLAVGYRYFFDDRPPDTDLPLVPANWVEHSAGDANIASTAGDLAEFLRMLLNQGRGSQDRVLQPRSFGRMVQRTVPAPELGTGVFYGYGVILSDDQGSPMIGHSGGMPGFRSMMLGDLDEGLGAVVLMNGPGTPLRVAEFAVRSLRAVQRGEEPPAVPVAAPTALVANATEYAGEFADTLGRRLFIVADGDHLWLQAGGRRGSLERMGQDRFLARHPDFTLFPLRFGRDSATGAVVEMSYGGDWFMEDRYRGPRRFQYPHGWGAYPGHYRAQNPFYSNYRVILRKGRLWLVAPEGTEDLLVEMEPGSFRVGNDPGSAERLRFDTVISGRALRATLSGVSYYRSDTP